VNSGRLKWEIEPLRWEREIPYGLKDSEAASCSSVEKAVGPENDQKMFENNDEFTAVAAVDLGKGALRRRLRRRRKLINPSC
jgi:hypothetical protein